MKKKITIAALLSVIATCLVVVSNTLAPMEDDGYRTPRERAIIKKFDKDGDGNLNKEEKRTADAAIKAFEQREKEAWMKRMDRNGDGKVSREEREAGEKAPEQRKREYLRDY